MRVVKGKSIGAAERMILSAMIMDRTVLARVANAENITFASKWANVVAGWCLKYFTRYGKAPRKAIEGLFERWSNQIPDDESTKLVEGFLDRLSDDYEELASDYVLDIAAKHFQQCLLLKLSNALQAELDVSNVDAATEVVADYRQIELGGASGIDVLNDKEAIMAALEARAEAIVKYDGALGQFFGNALSRDSLIAFMGPEKRGKTWWLMDVAWRAMLQRRKVAFFEVGDMSQDQIMQRFMVRASRQPLEAKTVKIPVLLENNGDGEVRIDLKKKQFDSPLDWRTASRAFDKIIKQKVKTKDPLLKLSTHANSTLSVAGVAGILAGWEQQQGWVPDVVVIDYADILAMPLGTKEERDGINMTWKQLRSLSQQLHCLVVTATQTDAKSYDLDTITRKNFSDDKRKLAHVNGMVGLNGSPDELAQQLMRVNWVVLREGAFSDRKCCKVATCLALGNPAVKSVW